MELMATQWPWTGDLQTQTVYFPGPRNAAQTKDYDQACPLI